MIPREYVGICEAYSHIEFITRSSHLTYTRGIVTTPSGENPQREIPFARHQLQLEIDGLIEYMNCI